VPQNYCKSLHIGTFMLYKDAHTPDTLHVAYWQYMCHLLVAIYISYETDAEYSH